MKITIERQLDIYDRAGAESKRTFDSAQQAHEYALANKGRKLQITIDGERSNEIDLYIAAMDERDAEYDKILDR